MDRNQLEDLVFPTDTNGLPRKVLEDVARRLALAHTGTQLDLNARLWAYVRDRSDRTPISWAIDRVFAGQIAVSWYKPAHRSSVATAAQRVLQRTTYYDKLTLIPLHEMDEDRVHVIGAAAGNLGGERLHVFRLAMKVSGRTSDGFEVTARSVPRLATMLISTDRGYIELRANSAMVPRLISRISQLIDIPEHDLRPELIAPFAEDIEAVADRLGGVVSGTVSKPEVYLPELTDEQAGAIIDVLDAVSGAIADPDNSNLVESVLNPITYSWPGTPISPRLL